MPKLDLDLGLFIVVSIGYIAVYTMVSGFVLPLQRILLPDTTLLFSILFLPHGIRVLAVWLLGWRGVLYLLPASYLMWAISVFGSGVELDPISPLISIICVYFAVFLLRGLSTGSEAAQAISHSWKQCLLAGFIASILSGLSLGLLYGSGLDYILMAGYTFGDIVGQIVMMLLLMLIMRLVRTSHSFFV